MSIEKFNQLKNRPEANKAQTEKNNLKGDYGQNKSSSEMEKTQEREQPSYGRVENGQPGITIPQEKYNQRQELIDRLCPHRGQNSDSSPIEEKSSNRF